jgi:flotillin
MTTFILSTLSFLGIALAVVVVFALIIFRRVVPTNMVHIVQSRKKATPYGRDENAGNVYYEWPYWIPVIGVTVIPFPLSNFDIRLDDYEAYDVARLPFLVQIVAFFRIDEAEMAARRISSFEELKQQLSAVVQGVVRRTLATNRLQEIMQERSRLGQEFADEIGVQTKEWGVVLVKSVEFMDIRDSAEMKSTVIADIMAIKKSEIERESRTAVAENIRDAQLKEIDAQMTVDVQRQAAEQLVGERTAEKTKAVGIVDEQAKQCILEEAKTTAQKDMAVKQVNDVRTAEIAKEVVVVEANQDREQREIAATADKQVLITVAEGKLKEAQLNAEGIIVEGEAQGKADLATLMAPVNSQIELAKEIGQNPGYQTYLVAVKQVEAAQAVGVEAARALQAADVKVISNAGDPPSGASKVLDLFTSTGGHNITAMLTALRQSEDGGALIDRLTSMAKTVVSSTPAEPAAPAEPTTPTETKSESAPNDTPPLIPSSA